MNQIKLEQAVLLRNRISALSEIKTELLQKLSEFERQNNSIRLSGGLELHERTELIDVARQKFTICVDLKIQEATKAFEEL